MKKLAPVVTLMTIFVFICLAAGTAIAQDKCSDILKDGTFKKERYRDNFYFQQIIYSRFLSSTYEQSKDDSDLGFGAPVGDIVLGGNYSREEFEQKKEQIRKEHLEQITTTREIDVALSSGDPVVVKNWSDCMKNRNSGAVSLRFEPVSNTEVFAILEWFAGAGINSTQLRGTIALPTGARFKEGADCFRHGAEITNTVGCRATIIFPDAYSSWPVSVNTPNGGTQAYLTPRLKPQTETDVYKFDIGRVVPGRDGSFTADENKDNLFTKAYRETKVVDWTVRLTQEQKNQGWGFDPKSVSVRLNKRRTLHRNGCAITRQEADLYSFTYSLRIWGRPDGRSANSTAVCDLTPFIKMERVVWIPSYPTVRAGG